MGEIDNLFLLDVWREACRHIEIAEAIDLITPLILRRSPVDQLLLRVVELDRSAVNTVAASARDNKAAISHPRTECKTEALEALLRWCRHGEIVRDTAEKLYRRLPGLLPPGITGDVMAGPLNTREGPPGALVAVALKPKSFDQEQQQLLKVLLEPFTVALENDRRLRELIALREKVEADNRSLLSKLGRNELSDAIVGAESGLRAVMERANLVSRADIPVLILGETGSGKEVVARAIHKQSGRVNKPFLRVNCGAIPPELVDSELFGHEPGSFTGATALRKGWFERADQGTLFLDECGELPLAAQVRLLRILQDGTYERVGGEKQLHVDVRVVAATHRNLQAMVGEGTFREDLWYRLAVFPIKLPPLRDRLEDIPALAAHFAQRASKRFGLPPRAPTPNDVNLLAAYPWPGNVRELASVMERAAILGDGKYLDVSRALGVGAADSDSLSQENHFSPGPLRDFTTAAAATSEKKPTATVDSLDSAMIQHIEAALRRTRGRIEGPYGAAKVLGINPHTLRARMRKLKIEWQSFRGI
jgi:hydrogenase-4 transcriptional activator